MRLPSITCAPTAVDADGVCASQSPAAGSILINGALATGGVVTFGAAQLVRLTSGGNDSGITFTFNGTDADGRTQTQTVAGTNASNTDTTLFFKTVTSITASAAIATTIIVGNLIGSVSPTIRPSHRKNNFVIGGGVVLNSGTATYEVQHSYDEYEGGSITDQVYPTNWFVHPTATAKTASFDPVTYTAPVSAIRLKVSASSSGNITGKFIESGA